MWRPTFTLKTLLWLVVVVAAFLGGMQMEWQIVKRQGFWREVYPKDGTNSGLLIIRLNDPLPDGYQELRPPENAASRGGDPYGPSH